MSVFKTDFPIFINNPDLVYLDSAATSQKPQVVLDAIMEYYQTYNANIHRGLYPIAEKATAAVEKVRRQVAKFINAKNPSEIIFTKNATEAINLVSHTWGKEHIQKNDVMITTIMEHHANFVPWQQLCIEKQAKLEIIDITDSGKLKIPQALNAQAYRASDTDFLLQKAKFLALTAVSNVLGTVNPLEEIIAKIKKRNQNLKVLIDASQAAPHMQIDVQKLGADFLVFTGHKIFAETGIGILYGKKELLDSMPPFLFGGDMVYSVTREKTTFADVPYKFEAGTQNIAGIISLGAAIEYVENIGFEAIRKHEHELTTYAIKRMKKIKGLTIYGSEEHRCGIISFELDGIHPHDIAESLGSMNICVRAGHHCAMPLHTRLGIPATTRVSLSLYNTQEDIDKLVIGIKVVKKLFK